LPAVKAGGTPAPQGGPAFRPRVPVKGTKWHKRNTSAMFSSKGGGRAPNDHLAFPFTRSSQCGSTESRRPERAIMGVTGVLVLSLISALVPATVGAQPAPPEPPAVVRRSRLELARKAHQRAPPPVLQRGGPCSRRSAQLPRRACVNAELGRKGRPVRWMRPSMTFAADRPGRKLDVMRWSRRPGRRRF